LAAFYKQQQRIGESEILYQEVLGHLIEWYDAEESKVLDENSVVLIEPQPNRDGQTHSTKQLWRERTEQLRRRILRTAQEAGLDQPATLNVLGAILIWRRTRAWKLGAGASN